MKLRLVNSIKKSLSNISDKLDIASNNDYHLIPISGITSRAQDIESGDLFVALPGEKSHGAAYADIALSRGAAAVLTDSAGMNIISSKLSSLVEPVLNKPILVKEDPRSFIGSLSAWFHGDPLDSMFSAGITGTNGKTTVTTLLYQLWRGGEIDAGLIGTIGTYIGCKESSEFYLSERTTPEADNLQSTFAVMRERKIRNLAMEVSSHALSQHRLDGSKFTVAGFTNLTQDHLDFHGSMADYFDAKTKLFTEEHAKKAFITVDDGYGKSLTTRSQIPVVTLSRFDQRADWFVAKAVLSADSWDISLKSGTGKTVNGNFQLLGEHNVDNLLLAVAIASESGMDSNLIEKLLPTLIGAPGRLERVSVGQKFHALVDYAHTPDAVSRVLATVRQFTDGRVIAILGCGGNRDKSKRSIMGNALFTGSDIAIFTSDNPRNEDPDVILDEMVGENTITKPSAVIKNRFEAISYAVSLAQPEDCVIVLGKGHELGQEISGVIEPFSDVAVLSEAIAGLK